MNKQKSILSLEATKYIYHQEDIVYSPFVFNLRRIEEANFEPGTKREWKIDPSQFMFMFIENGQLEVNNGTESVILSENEGVLYQEKNDIEWSNNSKETIKFNYIVLKGGNVSSLFNQKSKESFFKFKMNQELEKSFFDIISETKKIEVDQKVLSLSIYKLLIELNGVTNYEKHKFTQPAIDYVAEYYQNSELSVNDLANSVHVSYHYFIHLFKQENFISPQKYIKKYRLDKGLALLKESNQSIEDIAYTVGFKYKKAFIKACKEETGLLPLAYRKENKETLLKATQRKKVIFTNVGNIGDPFIILYENKYYMFSTDRNGGNCNIYVSEDLKTFRFVDTALNKNKTFGVADFWAPEVINYNNAFYLFYSARDKNGIFHINVAKSNTITGKYADIKKDEPLINLSQSTIDAHPFIDNDGTPYLFYSLDCSANSSSKITSKIYAIQLNKSFTQTIGEPHLIIGPSEKWEMLPSNGYYRSDAPFVFYKDGYYHLTYSCNFFADVNYCVGYAKSKKLFGPYKKRKEGPILNNSNGIFGPGHCSFFYDKKNVFRCVFHIRTSEAKNSANRRACIATAYISNNELIIDYK